MKVAFIASFGYFTLRICASLVALRYVFGVYVAFGSGGAKPYSLVLVLTLLSYNVCSGPAGDLLLFALVVKGSPGSCRCPKRISFTVGGV